ncbi:MAG: general secretion pathway protein A [Candidatus Azotimanducaceae bacterium]|jgi:general secretion pathway protein A
MYNDYFGLREAPFSIAPNPQYLFMSPRHREALAHLLYGIQSDGGFILLTGEVGTGKTTVCRCLLEQIPEDVDTAYILNPKQTAQELLATACDELHIDYPENASIKVLVDGINDFLLASHQSSRRTVLIIDEAQNLSVDVLEQLRLLTNLETNKRKLLQIILLGQPELLTILAKQELRQLSQRVTARFHLDALNKDEVADYIQHRLDTAGAKGSLFPPATVKRIYAISKGIPRLINLVCDRALLGTYVQNRLQVDVATINHAAKEILGETKSKPLPWAAIAAVLLVALLTTSILLFKPITTTTVVAESTEPRVTTPDPTADPTAELQIAEVVTDADIDVETPSDATTEEAIEEAGAKEPANSELAILIPTTITSVESAPGYDEQFDAFGALMKLWGNDVVLAKNTDPCEVARVSGLQCLSKLGSLRDVAHLNRPVIINLSTQSSSQWFVVKRIDNETITVITNGEEFRLDSDEILNYWSGFYTLLWRPPPAYQESIRRGAQGATVDWLLTQLAIVDGDSVPTITKNPVYDANTESRVKRFQISVGLVPDGVVGAQTWIHLNSTDSTDSTSTPRILDTQPVSNEANG